MGKRNIGPPDSGLHIDEIEKNLERHPEVGRKGGTAGRTDGTTGKVQGRHLWDIQ